MAALAWIGAVLKGRFFPQNNPCRPFQSPHFCCTAASALALASARAAL